MMPCANTAALRRYAIDNPGLTATEEARLAVAERAWVEQAAHLICAEPNFSVWAAFDPGLRDAWLDHLQDGDLAERMTAKLRRREPTGLTLPEMIRAEARDFAERRVELGILYGLTAEEIWNRLP